MKKLLSCILSITMILTSVLPTYAQALAQKNPPTPVSTNSHYYPLAPEIPYKKDNVLWQNALYTSILEKARKSEAEILPLLEFTKEKEKTEPQPLINYEDFKSEYQKKLNEQEKEYIKKAKSAEEIRYIKDFFVKAAKDEDAIQKAYQEAEKALQKDIEENPDKYHQLVYQELQPRVEVAVSLLGQSSVAEKVVPYLAAYNFLSDKQKQTAANIYRKRVIANQSFCGEISWWSGVKSVVGADGDIKEAQQKCTKAIEAASNLALVGANYDENTQDARALKDLLLSGYNGIVAPTVIQVTSQGLLALNAESLLASALLGIIRTPTIESLDVTLGMLSVETWVQVFQEASNVDNTFGSAIFAEGLEYSFYDNPEKGYSNKKNIWLDLARDLAEMADDPQEERNQQIKLALNSVMQDIVTYNSYGISIKFRPFVVGALLGGYEVEFPQPFEEEVMDRYGKIHTVKPNTKAWKSVTEHIKSTGFTNSQYIAWFLYNTKKIDLDPPTVQYMDNMLTAAFVKLGMKRGATYEPETDGEVTTYMVAKYVKTGEPVTMKSRRNPRPELYESHEYRQEWKKVGRFADIVLAIVGLVYIAKGIASLAKLGINGIKSGSRILKLARTGQLATGGTYRASVSRVLSRARAISGTASYKAAVYESIANSIGLSRMKLDVPIQEIRTAKAAAVTPKTKPVKIDVRELNGELFMVPEGTETFYVNGQVVYANKGTSLSKVAKKYGVDRSLVRRAKNGTSWQPKAPETPRYYGTGEAVAGSTGSQPIYTLKPTEPVTPALQTATITPATPVWTPKPVKKFEITPWKWYKASFQVGLENFASSLSSAFRFGLRNPVKATGMALSSYGLGGVAPISLVPETAQVVTIASPFTQPFRTFGAFQTSPKLGSLVGTTGTLGTASGANTLATTGKLWVNPFWAMFPPATSSHLTPVGAISTAGAGRSSGGNRKNDWWQSSGAFRDYQKQFNNWLFTSNSLIRQPNPFFLQDKWTDFTTSLSLDWQAFNMRRAGNPYYKDYQASVKANSHFSLASYVPPFVVDLAGKAKKKLDAFHQNNKANRAAKAILARKAPLLTDLRAILQGAADDEYKKQALLRLYTNTNLFKDVLKTLSRSSKKELRALQKADDAKGLGNFLFNLFKVGTFDQILEHLNNNIPTDRLDQDLAALIATPDFMATSRAVYDSTPVLSPESNNFTGVVESLQDVDIDMLRAAARGETWAAQNADDGQEVSGGWIYYDNDIPVYYRNSNGTLSETPAIILHQETGNPWSSFLAAVGLSTPKGIKVPKGMVLAMDENGRFKFVSKPGHRSELEDSKAARKKMDKIYEDGSMPVAIDTPYSTTDLLAIAKILEEGLPYNFDLILNAPNSFTAFVNGIGVLSGLGIDSVMVGPFKNLAPSSPVVPNAFGGIGYVTPRIAGEMSPLMQKWGMSKSTFLVLSSILLTLGIAIPLGINGFVPAEKIPLAALAAPMVVLILTASLLRSSIPLLLNHYKDPTKRTAANLQVSTWQQGAKVGMALFAGALPFAGGKFIAVPLAALATLVTLGFMMNTSLGKGVWNSFVQALKNKEIIPAIKKGAKPVGQALKHGFYLGVAGPVLDLKNLVSKWTKKLTNKNQAEEASPVADETLKEEDKLAIQFQKEYESDFLTDPDTKASLLRVTSAYASYAASLMLLNQVAEGPMGTWLAQTMGLPGIGKWITAIFAGAAFLVRLTATSLISKGRFTDDQLTGISFAGLALMPLILAALPYQGVGWSLGVLLAGIILNMSTAVPGQLDQTRLQNNVSAKILEQKNPVLSDESLTPEERAAKLTELEKKEKHWAAQASKSYSTANAKGIYGIYAAVLFSLLFPAIGISEWNWIARAVFVYAGLAASVGAVKTLDMAASFLKSLFSNKKLVITEENIAQKTITPQTFGIKDANKATKMIPTLTKGKENSLKTLKESLVPYGVVAISSEVKLTKILKRMIEIHNRLVAAAELLGVPAVATAFEQLRDLAENFKKVLENSNVSTSLRREFEKLAAALCVDGDVTKGVLATPAYMPEGAFDIPAKYRNLLEARDLILELEVLSRNIKQGGVAVTADTYKDFKKYHDRAIQLLLTYERENPSEASIVSVERERIKRICKALRRTKSLGNNAQNVSPQDIRDLNDLLKLY